MHVAARPRLAFAALLALSGAHLAIASRHLTNVYHADAEFTGWCAALAERVYTGQPYREAVVPIPPGSFLILRALASFAGQSLLRQELALIAACQLALTAFAYLIARAFVTPRRALAVAALSFVLLVSLAKELAYDHTAEVCAWAAIACGAHALSGTGTRRARGWLLAGALAGVTHAFKQTAGLGVTVGWLVALGYSAWLARSLRTAWSDIRAFLLGFAPGLAAAWTLPLLCGATLGEYLRTIYVDAGALKGGLGAQLHSISMYLLRHDLVPGSIVLCLSVLWLWRRGDPREPLLSASELRGAIDAGPRSTLLHFAVVIFAADLLLLSAPHALPDRVALVATQCHALGPVGLVIGLTHAASEHAAPPQGADGELSRAFRCTLIAALITSLTMNLSFPTLRPFYDNNPVIPLALVALWRSLERARVRGLQAVVLAISLGGLFDLRLQRLLESGTPAPAGHWAGMRIGARSQPLLRAADRARQLAGERGTVLVLPEDLQMSALIERARPPLHGAVVFVDQYPARVLAHDLSVLDATPPDVVVLLPAEPLAWRAMFGIWNTHSPAAELIDHVAPMLIKDYHLDSAYPVQFGTVTATLEVWSRVSASSTRSSAARAP